MSTAVDMPRFVRAEQVEALPPPQSGARARRLGAREPVLRPLQHDPDARRRATSSTSSIPPLVQLPVHRCGLDRHGPGRPAAPIRPGSASRRLLGLHLRTSSTTSSTAPTRSSERWRVNIFFAAARRRRRLAALAEGAAARPGRDLLLRRLPARLVLLLTGATWLGLRAGADLPLGRHPRHAPGRDGRHRVLAALRHPSGARAALEAADRADGLGDLHRVRARRAAHHRADHGQHHAAALPARRHDRRPSAAATGRHRALRLRLHGRGGARRPAGHAEGPV